jgi:hypothetical protein
MQHAVHDAIGNRRAIVEHVNLIIAVLGLGFAAACQSPSAPMPPKTPPIETGLIIQPQRSGIRVNAAVAFSAAVTYSDETSKAVTATWSTDNPAVADIDTATGTVKGVSFGRATIGAAYGAYRSSLTLRVVPDLNGTWIGWFRIATCDRRSGSGPSPCRFEIGSVQPVQLTVVQTDDVASGLLRLFADPATVIGPIAGTVDETGVLTLTGSLAGGAEAGQATINDWKASASGSSIDTMVGQFTMTSTFNNIEGPQVLVNTCDRLSLSKQ